MKVTEIMSSPVITVNETATLAEVALTMVDHQFGCVPVVNERGELTGIISESDFAAKGKGIPFTTFQAPQVFGRWLGKSGAEKLYEAARSLPAGETMNRNIISVTEDATVEDVLELMLEYDVNRIPVLRGKIPVGIVARYDLLKLMFNRGKNHRTAAANNK